MHVVVCHVGIYAAFLGGFILGMFPEADLSGKNKAEPKLEIVKPQDPVEGIYSFWGLDGSKPYRGSLHVLKVHDAYLIKWDFTSYSMRGTGMLKGDVLTIGWFLEGDKAPIVGAHTMKKCKDGWDGEWIALPGTGRIRPEHWMHLGNLPRVEGEMQ